MNTIGIATNSPLFSAGITTLLSSNNNYSIVLEIFSSNNLIAALKTANELPTILIVDTYLVGSNRAALVRVIKKDFPNLKLIAIGTTKEKNFIINLFNAGINAYVNYTDDPICLIKALQTVIERGYFYHNYPISKINATVDWKKYGFIGEITLSHKEVEFIQYCATKSTYQTIAATMLVSIHTINNYSETVFRKCAVNSRQELVVFAFKNGIIE